VTGDASYLSVNEGEKGEEKERERGQGNGQTDDKLARIGRIPPPSLSPAAQPATMVEDRRGSHGALTRNGSPAQFGDRDGAGAPGKRMAAGSIALAPQAVWYR